MNPEHLLFMEAPQAVGATGYLAGVQGDGSGKWAALLQREIEKRYPLSGSTRMHHEEHLTIALRTPAPQANTSGTVPPLFGLGFPLSGDAGASGQYLLLYRDKRQWVLETDFCGSHPLFYTTRDGVLLFASDLALLLALTGPVEASPDALLQYLFFNFPFAPGTYYKDIYRLPPAHRLRLTEEGAPHLSPVPHCPTETRDIGAQLRSSVSRLLDTKPGAVFHLSGGIDSSLLCHLAAQRGEVVHTFTAYHDEQEADFSFARMVAAETGAQQIEHLVPVQGLPADWERLMQVLGSPVMATGVATFLHTAAASGRRFRYCVTGIGGDHPFTAASKLHLRHLLPKDRRSLFDLCLNVQPQELKGLIREDVLAFILSELRARFHELTAAFETPAEAIERFYFLHFLQEHLRMAQATHAACGIGVYSPFLLPGVLLPALKAVEADPSLAVDKQLFRSLLAQHQSVAASRFSKEQMALNGPQLAAVISVPLQDLIAATGETFDFVDYGRVREVCRPGYSAGKSEARFLWLLFNLHSWQRRVPGCSFSNHFLQL